MSILKYTCTNCGLVTRVQAGQDYRACGCFAEYDIEVDGYVEDQVDSYVEEVEEVKEEEDGV